MRLTKEEKLKKELLLREYIHKFQQIKDLQIKVIKSFNLCKTKDARHKRYLKIMNFEDELELLRQEYRALGANA